MNDAPVVLVLVRVQVQEERGQTEPGAQDDPGRDVAATAALDADDLQEGGRADPEGQEAPELVETDEEGGGTAGRGHVGQRVPGEGLAAGHGEHADDA